MLLDTQQTKNENKRAINPDQKLTLSFTYNIF